MAYPEDLVGKYIQNPIENRALGGDALKAFQNGVVTDMTKQMTRAVHPTAPALSQAPTVQGGRPTLTRQPAFRGAPWSFLLLEYVPGLVTAAPVGATGILTGWMSGCYLFRYTLGGTKYVAHVGTDVASAEKSKKAKEIWRDFVDNSGATDVMGGNPARDVSLGTVTKAQQEHLTPQIAGYFGANGAARVMTFGKNQHDTSSRFYGKVLGIDLLPLSPWDDLKDKTPFTDD